jgi:hypothetical protein
MYMETLRSVSASLQLEWIRRNAGGATWRLCYESCLQGINAKQVTTEDICEGTSRLWRSSKWTQKVNRHLEMVHAVSGKPARFTILSHAIYKRGK